MIIKRYSNIDWAGDNVIRKSMSKYIFILNREPVKWYLKYKSKINFLIKAKYVVLTMAVKEVIWLWFLLTKLNLLLPSNQYAKIKVAKKIRDAKKIKANFKDQEKEDNEDMASKTILIDFFTSLEAISLKGNNQRSIVFIHNLIYHAQMK